MNDVITLAKQLIEQQSVTPNDADCQKIITERLKAIGFNCNTLPFGEVTNLWAEKQGTEQGPCFVFAGHTDVVPTGPEEEWQTPPFQPTIKDEHLYGRGAADMKGGVAAMICAVEQFVKDQSNIKGSIGFLLTSDEEGPAINGTVKVIEWLSQQNKKIDYCLVGEPSSKETLGDIIRPGRRGSLTANITFEGKQGHIAYPQLAKNPIHHALPKLAELINKTWDKGSNDFPPTTCQIANINGGTGVSNVIPGTCTIQCNWRYSTAITAQDIKQQTTQCLDKSDCKYTIDWHHSGKPFLTKSGELTKATEQAIKKITGTTTRQDTGGGTSDARFIAPTGAQVIELGPLNATIHQINENVSTEDLQQLTKIYYHILASLLT